MDDPIFVMCNFDSAHLRSLTKFGQAYLFILQIKGSVHESC